MRERLSYQIDLLMSRQGASLFFLVFVTATFTLFGGFIYHFSQDDEITVTESLWRAWTFVADPGTHAGEDTAGSRLASLFITLGGFVSFALLIGLVGELVGQRVEDLKKGRSKVLEHNHTLVLGWNEKVISFLNNLAIANESLPSASVVILADVDKELMENTIRESCNLRGTRVICRTGSIMSTSDLIRVSASDARCIVVLADENNKAVSDARALRTVLALVRGLKTLSGHIVVELIDKENSNLLEMAGEGNVVPVVAHEMIGRLLIQCARQPGLAEVYCDLLSFDGSEFYLKEWPQLVGLKFIEVCFHFEGAVVCGISKANGQMVINPSNDTIIESGDSILVIAEDDSTYDILPKPLDLEEYKKRAVTTKQKEAVKTIQRNVLFCGWRRNMEEMIRLIDDFQEEGSCLTIMTSVDNEMEKRNRENTVNSIHAKNVKTVLCFEDPQSRSALEKLISGQKVPFSTVVVFSQAATTGSLEESNNADSLVLVTTLFIQDIQKKLGNECDLVSEICSPNTKSLISSSSRSGWVVSNELIAMILAQMAECRENRLVWEELFLPEGNEIYFKPIAGYVEPGEEVCFWDLFTRARERAEVLIGWCEEDRLVINPVDKKERRALAPSTDIIVLCVGKS
uniref:RCK N-terminal domain-containing protein n=1 Tax=Arcella intermedia TaxID=1963864 RepID=A0A6B2KZP9_9EUKA